ECQCLVRTVTCQSKPCQRQCAHPMPPTRDACCPLCEGCLYEGQEYVHRAVFTPPSDPCRHCSCLGGNVLSSCQPVPCKDTLCSHPAPGPCCPMCHDCIFEGEHYAHGQGFQPESCLQCICQVSAHLCPWAQLSCHGMIACPRLSSIILQCKFSSRKVNTDG
uniref:VWFC domain-containing protein n=1 Tax=Laticauda laticaudata TaxID=8630 RepID=A0A8C5RAR1_LATLA